MEDGILESNERAVSANEAVAACETARVANGAPDRSRAFARPKPELLAPAGGMDQLRYALYYGADAVYLAADRFGLRARAANFALDDIPAAVSFAHGHGAKVYVTCNVLMESDDLKTLPAYLEALEDAGADAVIVSDLGALSLARRHAPKLAVHVSTQASVANAEAAKVWHGLGASRIVCAREMSVADIAEMRSLIPDDLEIEAFVHGAMCMAVSGRCLISDYLAGRSGNKGNCTQPCRWSYRTEYRVEEEYRPGEWMPVEEDGRGAYVFNARDMNMLAHVDDLRAAGVDSLKIEGRNKKAFYVATVVNAYRQVLDGADPAQFAPELETISHRPYSTGFYYGRGRQAPQQDGYLQTHLHAATVEACGPADASDARIVAGAGDGQAVRSACVRTAFVRCHNRFAEGETLEVISPGRPVRTVAASNLRLVHGPAGKAAGSGQGSVSEGALRAARDVAGAHAPADGGLPPAARLLAPGSWLEKVPVANRSMELYAFDAPFELFEHDLLRARKR